MVNTATERGRSLPLQDASDRANGEESSESDTESNSSGMSLPFPKNNVNLAKIKSSYRLPWSIGFSEAIGRENGFVLFKELIYTPYLVYLFL